MQLVYHVPHLFTIPNEAAPELHWGSDWGSGGGTPVRKWRKVPSGDPDISLG
jgi:hypothetical protein